jgi:molybdopterin molybdotransferase
MKQESALIPESTNFNKDDFTFFSKKPGTQMISVNEARRIILQNCNKKRIAEVPLTEASGFIISETVHSKIDTPPFDQSAMDGYAFSFEKWDGKSELMIVGEVKAGDSFLKEVGRNETVRIFTGAALPPDADSVVIQEKVFATEKFIKIEDDYLKKGNNVRPRASQTKKDEIVFYAGQLITPATVSFLASVGFDKVKVFSNPSVSVIVTGNELIKPGENIVHGKIFESNAAGLFSALRQLNIFPVSVSNVNDDASEMKKEISNQLTNDILIITGGISVGEYDLVASALTSCGVQQLFHKVKQKPGKPFYFGKLNETLVFALPGNPASVLTCFYEFIVPAISMFTQKDYFKKLKMPLAGEFKKKPGFTYFLKGKTNENEVVILDSQESYKMNSFAVADCLIELDEQTELYKKGDWVNVKMII